MRYGCSAKAEPRKRFSGRSFKVEMDLSAGRKWASLSGWAIGFCWLLLCMMKPRRGDFSEKHCLRSTAAKKREARLNSSVSLQTVHLRRSMVRQWSISCQVCRSAIPANLYMLHGETLPTFIWMLFSPIIIYLRYEDRTHQLMSCSQ